MMSKISLDVVDAKVQAEGVHDEELQRLAKMAKTANNHRLKEIYDLQDKFGQAISGIPNQRGAPKPVIQAIKEAC